MSVEVLEYIQKKQLELQYILEEAQNDIPLNHDEYYESDEYYLGAINALREVLVEYGVLTNV
jgi:hypothetical protein